MEKFEKDPKEQLSSKNFLPKLEEVPFDMEKAKKAIYESGLKKSNGWKLIKAESLFEAGKLRTKNDLDNASAVALTDDDITAFLNKYNGDEYVKRLFVYGKSHMKRYFETRKREFEKDKAKKGVFDNLDSFNTFEDAFNAQFYGNDFSLEMPSIMEEGLSACEYKNRDERFKILENKIKKLPKENAKIDVGLSGLKVPVTGGAEAVPTKVTPVQKESLSGAPKERFDRLSISQAKKEMPEFSIDSFGIVKTPDGLSVVGQLGQKERKENPAETPQWNGELILDKSLVGKLGGKESVMIIGNPKAVDDLCKAIGITRRNKDVIDQREKREKSIAQLKVVGEKMFEMEKFMVDALAARMEKDNEQLNRDFFGDLIYFQPLVETKDKEAYVKGFLEAVTTEDAMKRSFDDDVKEDEVALFTDGYDGLIAKRFEQFDRLERALYVKADGTSDPRGTKDEASRAQQVAEAEAKYPELKVMGGYKQAVKSEFRKWKTSTQNIFPENK